MSTPVSPVGSAVVAAVSSLAVPAVSAVAKPGTAALTVTKPGMAAAAVAKPVLTAEQKTALKHLHETAQQFESLFVNMLFKSMRAASPQTSITGEPQSPAETTFTEMLDAKRSETMAETGAFGIGKILEDQLRSSVLANPAGAAKARMAPEGIL
jgi:Rod binding domain-containing protein